MTKHTTLKSELRFNVSDQCLEKVKFIIFAYSLIHSSSGLTYTYSQILARNSIDLNGTNLSEAISICVRP